MDNSDKAEMAAFIHHSPGQPHLEHEIQDTTTQGAAPETADETTCEREGLSTNQIGCAFSVLSYFISELDIITSECFCQCAPAKEAGIDRAITRHPKGTQTTMAGHDQHAMGQRTIGKYVPQHLDAHRF